MFVVTNTFQPAFTGISSFFFVPDPKITLEEGLDTKQNILFHPAFVVPLGLRMLWSLFWRWRKQRGMCGA
jgi:hypothetical protein